METLEAQKKVAETGTMLLRQGLVARTWGNVSCRIDENYIAITPSGLDYVGMTAADIAIMNMKTGEWQGSRKPSGEKGVHCAAYQTYADTCFIIHTHQTYATAIGLAGFETLKISDEEDTQLGGIALAEYGLPGTKKLTMNVKNALESGAKVILMAQHGALICGNDREDAFKKAILLEEICKRSLKGQPETVKEIDKKVSNQILSAVQKEYCHSAIIQSPAVMEVAALKNRLRAQMDDMAQMIGPDMVIVKPDTSDVLHALSKSDAVLIHEIGAVVKAKNDDDMKALCILVEKAAICNLHTNAVGKRVELSWLDTRLMALVYKMKYSKQK